MKYSGLFFIINPSTNLETSGSYLTELIQSIETNLQNVVKGSAWSLSYRAFRDTIDAKQQSQNESQGNAKPFLHTYQHMLNHTNIAADRTYIHIQPANTQGVIVSIPRSQQDSHALLIRHHMAALWAPRHALRVEQGLTYDNGLYTVQVGELRASREGPQSGTTYSPGVVVCISTNVGSDTSKDSAATAQPGGSRENGNAPGEGDIDFEYAQAIIKDCWRRIKGEKEFGGRAEVRDAMMLPKLVTTEEQEREAAVRMWSEILRLRGIVEPLAMGSDEEGTPVLMDSAQTLS